MSTTQDDNNRKHPRGGDEEGEEVNLLHDQQDQESSQKRPKVDDNTSAQTLSTTAEEDEVSVELVIGNSGDHVENAPNNSSINTATAEVYDTTSTAEAPQQSVVSTTAPIARNTSIPEQEIPQYDPDYVDRLFCEKFKVGTWFDSAEELRNEVKQFGNVYFFVMRKQYLFCTCVDGNGIILCRKEGNVTKSYADLFIYNTAVTSSLQSLENVFLKSTV